jgi:hypothetical protein
VAAALAEARGWLSTEEGHTQLQWVDAWQLGCDDRALRTAAKAGAMAAAAAAGEVRANAETHTEVELRLSMRAVSCACK